MQEQIVDLSAALSSLDAAPASARTHSLQLDAPPPPLPANTISVYMQTNFIAQSVVSCIFFSFHSKVGGTGADA